MGLIETTKEGEGWRERTMTAERQREESDLDNGRWVRDWGTQRGGKEVHVQIWAIRWALGCVNSRSVARGSREAGFTQPRVRLLADPCRV